ncbi:MAG: type I DNA topoisomerase [Candidatus Brennerbacteria bacterium]|nr:type I DNA topoisomerase [Candidatus Brennerbacteria bacterium]
MNLVIVESPTKARTIGKFLDKSYQVESSYGHIRDLPKSELGVDEEKNFEPRYVIPTKSRKNVNVLKKLAGKAESIILATDEDREGEAIAWHLTEALGLGNSKFEIRNSKLPQVERIVFHEITERAIQEALKNPRGIDMNLVNAQQARRVLDRLVGYKLSPFLWKKVFRGLSAGRVQSVALRLIVEREEEIRKLKPEEYWSVVVKLRQETSDKEFEALLSKINGEVLDKFAIKNETDAKKIAADLEKSDFAVTAVEKKEIKKNPLPPFITSTMQQEAAKRLRFSAKQTMFFAQHLYENGFITYMRTDSVNLSQDSLAAARDVISKEFGKEYLIESPRVFKTKSRLAQEAHEAIRPTDPALTPAKLKLEEPREKKLYDLVWRRFIASQMPQARFDSTRVDIEAKSSLNPKPYTLVANGNILRFDGFLKVWSQKFEEKELPELEKGEDLKLIKVKPDQHFTQPPPRYNEASLIKSLETEGIGRPSTYAPTISVIQFRNYVQKNEDRRFEPTEVGEIVNKVLTEHFPEIVDIKFTAGMEEGLDKIAEGKKKWQGVIREFYTPFAEQLEKKYEEVSKKEFVQDEKTDEVCDKCGKPMVIKTGRFGKFLACTGFPDCKNTKSLKNNVGITDENGVRMKCPKCNEGEIIRRRTKRGRFFYGCTRWPDCDFASWQKPTIEADKRG